MGDTKNGKKNSKTNSKAKSQTNSQTSEMKFTEKQTSSRFEGRVHFRRCHMCNQVSEQTEATVETCMHCGKAMAPFFFFDEFTVQPESDEAVRLPPMPGQHMPVRGLTAFW